MLAFDAQVSPTLLRRFEVEAHLDGGDGRHFAVMQRSAHEMIGHNPGSPELDPNQMMWATDVLKLLNKELHHDGAWVVVFSHPEQLMVLNAHSEYGRYALIWLDSDGDPQFSQEWLRNDGELLDFSDVMAAGIYSTANKCEGSWAQWSHLMRDVLKPKGGETFRRARGEAPTSTARH